MKINTEINSHEIRISYECLSHLEHNNTHLLFLLSSDLRSVILWYRFIQTWIAVQIISVSLASIDDKIRSLTSTVTRENFRLEGHLIESVIVDSQITCSHYCVKNTRCLSINYKKFQTDLKGRCELNFAGLSNDLDNKYLIPTKEFVFSQIRCRKVRIYFIVLSTKDEESATFDIE